MTQDEIIDMAKEAGLRKHIPFWSDSEVADALEAFAKLVAKAAVVKERSEFAVYAVEIMRRTLKTRGEA